MDYREESVILQERLIKQLKKKYELDKDIGDPTSIISVACFTYNYGADYERNYIYYSELLIHVNRMMGQNATASQIFNRLIPAVARTRKKIDAGKISLADAEQNVKDVDKMQLAKAISRRIDFLETNNYSREMLEKYEKKQVKISMRSYGHFRNKTARGKVIGALNKGFYLRNINEIKEYVNDNGGKTTGKDRFVSIMPDELLRYKIALMDLVQMYTTRTKIILSPSKTAGSLERLQKSVKELGQIAREKYISDYNCTPEDALINCSTNENNESIPGQISLEDIQGISRVRK